MASATTKQRGVLIAFHNTTPFTLHREIKDPEGRYIILTGLLLDNEITIVSYYAPNRNPLSFLSHLFSVVESHKKGTLMMCGDSNQVLYPILDKSPTPLQPQRLNFRQLLEQHSLIDSWREQNPRRKQYTYYSHPHKTFSRIDHQFVHIGTLPQIHNSLIIPCAWSDHNAVMTSFSSLIPRPSHRSWTINDNLLVDPTYRLKIETAIQDYIANNLPTDTNPLNLWEALKPSIRGVCISQSSYRRKLKQQMQNKLEEAYYKASEIFQNLPSQTTKLDYDKAKLELDLFLTDSAIQILRKTKHTIYMKANKPTTFLALTLRRADHIPKPIRLQITKNNFSSNPQKIINEFRRKLKDLYQNTQTFDSTKLDALLSSILLPTLSVTQQETLDKQITNMEVISAIKSLKLHKRPGPDGYSATFYKHFTTLLAPLMTNAFNSLLEGCAFNAESLLASISMIPKPHADDTSWSNYRPISILNIDIKILAKILSNRLNPIIGTLIHKDQTGFIPFRQAGDNIRRATLLAHIARSRKIPACFLSIDIQKAFDTLSWSYLKAILHKWGFGERFQGWISSLYHNPKAYITYSGYRSDPFNIERGTRQGCPLSPLLFSLAIEPLAQLIRSNINIKGLELGGHQHKLCLFADDVLVFLTSPLLSAPNLIEILTKFGKISGLKINQQKSKALNISLSPDLQKQLQDSLPFTWSTTHLPYLGISLTANPADLYSANYPPMLTQLSTLLRKWSSLPLAWMGRITVVKMSILPKILYLFRVLPINVPAYFFRILQRKSAQFIWGKLKPRLPQNTLHMARTCGGLGVPNFSKYYYASQLAQIIKYHATKEIPLWVTIESVECDPLSISNLLWLSPPQRRSITNLVTKHSLSIWDRLKFRFGLQSPLNPLLSFLNNPSFYPAWTLPSSFKAWINVGLTRVHHFYDSDKLISFPTISKTHNIPSNETFRFLQIKNFLSQNIPTNLTTPEYTSFERSCMSDPHRRGLISDIYAQLLSQTNSSPPSYTTKWEADLNLPPDSLDWSQIWQSTKSATPNIVALETNYKVLTRWYLVPARISKYLPQYPPHCFRGCSDIGTHLHIWWTCPIVQTYWSKIFQILSTMFETTLQPDPLVALLNNKPRNITQRQFKLLLYVTTAAKQSIAKAWKTNKLCDISVKQRVTQAMIHAKMEAIILDKLDKFESLWLPWITHILPPDLNYSLLLP